MVIRKTLPTGERMFVLIKSEEDAFSQELGERIREVINNYKRIDLNKTQVIPFSDEE